MADTATAIRAARLTKLYGNPRGGLDLSFTVDTGEMFGFVGSSASRRSG
jgi:ABC-type phosphonate transport system ATPase subunit